MHREEAAKQLPSLASDHIIGEPCGRDTAACIGLGAALIARHDPNAVMLVTPADHVIEPVQEFRRAAQVATAMAEEHPSSLITFGIPPSYPATGYGYIQRGKEIATRQGVPVFQVQAFREKPSAELAERFVASGDYYWNAGIFVWKAATILTALQERQPKLYAAVQRIAESWSTPERENVLHSEYDALDRISIDYAVMEQAKEVLVVQAPYRWMTSAAGSPWNGCTRKTRRQHHPRFALRPENHWLRRRRRGRTSHYDGRRRKLAYHSRRQRDTGRRSPRRGHRQTTRRAAQEQGAGEVPVKERHKLLGIDYGTVRIGLAVSDPDRKFAFPLQTHECRNREVDGKFFLNVIQNEEIGSLLVGLPVHLSGDEGQKAKEARSFGKWLSGLTGLPVIFWDERYSSVEAETHLLAAGLTSKRRKARRDRVAAQIFLQSYLDAGCPADTCPLPLRTLPVMTPFDATCYGSVIADVLSESRLMPLGPGTPNVKARAKLATLTPEMLVRSVAS